MDFFSTRESDEDGVDGCGVESDVLLPAVEWLWGSLLRLMGLARIGVLLEVADAPHALPPFIRPVLLDPAITADEALNFAAWGEKSQSGWTIGSKEQCHMKLCDALPEEMPSKRCLWW